MQYIAIKNDDLRHSGVKGMRWGHRKTRAEFEKEIARKVAKKELKDKQTKEALISNYKGKTMTDHVLTGLGGVVASNLIGGALISRGQVEVGTIIGQIGTIAAIGNTIGNVYNQNEYNKKYAND